MNLWPLCKLTHCKGENIVNYLAQNYLVVWNYLARNYLVMWTYLA